ncbi:MAG: hypothetical protein GY868_04340, partial [Deltaproteobacteria bacterium]|nr:hypothetical protein [Deltaproteobacteria bacterium]
MDDFRISDMKRRRQEGDAAPPHPDSRPAGEGPGEQHGVFPGSASAPGYNQLAETINLRQYWETILRYRLFVVGITLAVFLATLLTNYLKQPRYKTQVEILRKEEIGGRGSAMESKFYLPETLIKIAVSRMVSEKSVAFLADAMQALAENGHEISDKDWEIARNVTPQELPGTLNARLDSDSPDILYIEAVSEKSEIIVAAFANAAARSFILRLSSIDQKEASQKCIILKGLKDAKQKEINDIEAKILSLKRRHEEGEDSFAVIAADERRLLDLVAEYEMLYQENKLKQEELHEQVKSIKHELNIDGTPTDTIQWVDMSNVMEKKLQELKMKRAELLTRYTPDNPLVSRLSS